MKKFVLLIAMISFSFGFAQNEDKISKTVTTKTKIKSSAGEEVAIQEKKYTSKQALEVNDSNKVNQEAVRSAVEIKESTTFSVGNENYTIEPDKNGYVMMTHKNGEKKMYGKIRKMPDHEFYILVKENENSFGYFDEDKNFIVESYDPASDMVLLKKYNLE
ncbi:hypothetical protein SAMN04488096_102210 [Mesonia phycicola]|uniref:WG containing repeat-containing protein n=1 Tax=Mesonia phycicola TaxID=579105 RepID=A0A1M6BTB8_9FLAO|nr:hypothetical protein [Mesonia phycicola]SHI51947.1 hypothetical protein SAMN04488096_102210 [Mesonia phycicola]